jgi:hypothetical protein
MQSLNFSASAVADVAWGLRHMAQLGTSPLQGIVTPPKKRQEGSKLPLFYIEILLFIFWGPLQGNHWEMLSKKGEDLAPTNCPKGFGKVMVFLHLCTTSVIAFLYFDGIKFIFGLVLSWKPS